MDPDALGSLWALYLILKKLWKNVKAVNSDFMPDNFSFLISKDIFEQNVNITEYNPDVIISFDAASQDQLWEIYEKHRDFFHSKEFFVIDHHVSNTGFWKYNYIETSYSSTSEMIFDILWEMEYQDYIDDTIATLLLAWIHADTNIFYNKNTNIRTFEIATNLIKMGAKNREIIYELFRKKTLEKAKLWGELLSNLQSHNNGKIVWINVKKSQYENLSDGDQWLKWLLNEFLANIEWVDVAFLLYEQINGNTKWSLRSNNDTIDVAKIAGEFGGGGHKLAAGFSSPEWVEDVCKKVLKKLL